MSSDSSKSHGPEVIMFSATSEQELDERLRALLPYLDYPLLVSILLPTALMQESVPSLENGFGFASTISSIH